MTMSAGRVSIMLAKPTTIATIPQLRHEPRHKHSHSPPSEISKSPDGGNRGVGQTLPGSVDTCCATQIVTSIPQPIGTSARRSRPNGNSRQVTTPQGNVQSALNGTAMTLASGE